MALATLAPFEHRLLAVLVGHAGLVVRQHDPDGGRVVAHGHDPPSAVMVALVQTASALPVLLPVARSRRLRGYARPAPSCWSRRSCHCSPRRRSRPWHSRTRSAVAAARVSPPDRLRCRDVRAGVAGVDRRPGAGADRARGHGQRRFNWAQPRPAIAASSWPPRCGSRFSSTPCRTLASSAPRVWRPKRVAASCRRAAWDGDRGRPALRESLAHLLAILLRCALYTIRSSGSRAHADRGARPLGGGPATFGILLAGSASADARALVGARAAPPVHQHTCCGCCPRWPASRSSASPEPLARADDARARARRVGLTLGVRELQHAVQLHFSHRG